MTSSLYNLALDFSKELNYTKAIMARQGDKGITVTVKPFLNGLQMDTSGGTFTLKGTTPSNRYVDSVATSVTSDEVTFSLDGTFMSEAGYYKHCYVEYRKGDQILTTQDIIFFSLGVSDISQGQADEYVSQLEELIRKYNETFDAFMAEIKGRVDSLNKQITDLTDQAKTLQNKLDALKEEISKLGNLQVMYSNSIDFGGKGSSLSDFLDAPYYLSKVPLQENIANTAVQFPISSSKYTLYSAKMQEPFVVGNTYTITLEGTKPSTQAFRVYGQAVEDYNYGSLEPVEGLVNTWSLTFTTSKVSQDHPNLLQILQQPGATVGACTINWLKIEKGDSRTPNIDQYKYRGISMRYSNNPKDYVWDLAPEYVEKNLATENKITEIIGEANKYTDEKASQIDSQLTTAINEVDTIAKDAQTLATANEADIKSTNDRIDEIDRIITALTKEETYLLPASIVSGGSLKFTSRGGMTVATGSIKLAKDIAFGEVLVDDLPDSMINIDNNAIGTGAVTGNSVSQIYVESNTRKVVANTAMKKDQWFTVGFSYHSKLSI